MAVLGQAVFLVTVRVPPPLPSPPHSPGFSPLPSQFGNPFMARRSYLPTEMHWGHKFEEIIEKPPPGIDDARYIINLNK